MIEQIKYFLKVVKKLDLTVYSAFSKTMSKILVKFLLTINLESLTMMLKMFLKTRG